jgi:two-component system chemotaxis response regulator CheY
MVRRVATRIIRDIGFEVTEARSGQEALDYCADRIPTAVMFDWNMGDMDALSWITQLQATVKRADEAMPILIFCTGERRVDQIVEALKAGANEYIMKPFDSDIIRSKFALAGLLSDPNGGAPLCAVA